MTEINKIHEKNKKILKKQGFIITNYANNDHLLILCAYHKDGRKVNIRV